MQLSVVVPTLNGRDRLESCLDALAEHAPEAEVVVVNGPSTDGTTGMIQERSDVDVLLEISERNVNVARNAGIDAMTGDAVAILRDGYRVEASWTDAVTDALSAGADAVTGPTHQAVTGGMETNTQEVHTVAGRDVTYFDGGNVAFTRSTIRSIDGFDEYLQTGGARDAAHRLAARDRPVEWASGMCVQQEVDTDGGVIREDIPRPYAGEEDIGRNWGWKYRSLTYRMTKNYGVHPAVTKSVFGHAARDAVDVAGEVFRGEESAADWVSTGRSVLSNIAIGWKDGLSARFGDRTPRRNPNGVSTRSDRAVAAYDWR